MIETCQTCGAVNSPLEGILCAHGWGRIGGRLVALAGALLPSVQAGRRAGGRAVASTYGSAYMAELGARGGRAGGAVARDRGVDFRSLGRRGAARRAANLAARRAEDLRRQEAAPGVALVSRARSPLALSVRLRLRAPR